MDPRRFDRLTKTLTLSAGRRKTLFGVLGSLLATLLPEDEAAGKGKHHRGHDKGAGHNRGRHRHNDVASEKRKQNKKKKKKCKVQCGGKVCGPSNCKGKSCGACPDGLACDAQGQCTCLPRCDGKQCGPSGCPGDTCGACDPGLTCDEHGQCVCVPDCLDKVCGPNGCPGGSCGDCPAHHACNVAGTCDCVPQCDGRHCGDDGCGGICGACSGSTTCDAERGTCVGCNIAGDCGAPLCREVTCESNTCEYAVVPDGGSCGGAPGICCDGSCRNTDSDPQNCGGCGQPCGSRGDRCAAGICRCGSAGGPTCQGDLFCQDEQCACPSGQKACGTTCVATSVCCSGGAPDCPGGQRCCGGECIASDACCNAPGEAICGNGKKCCGETCIANDQCCSAGALGCGQNQKCCGGSCIPINVCCTNGSAGQCTIGGPFPNCCNGECRECCATSDCTPETCKVHSCEGGACIYRNAANNTICNSRGSRCCNGTCCANSDKVCGDSPPRCCFANGHLISFGTDESECCSGHAIFSGIGSTCYSP